MATTPNAQPDSLITPPLSTKRSHYAFIYLSAGFIILSATAHFIMGAAGERFFPQFKEQATPPPQKVTVQTLIKPPPTTKPTPPPTPTPLPTPTPPPSQSTPPPAHLKMNVIKTHNEGGTGPAEVAYTSAPHGDENGVPQGPPTTAPAAPAAEPARPQEPVGITDAEYKYKAPVDYPEPARQQSTQGTAIVLVTIGTSGELVAVKIYRSSGSPLLDNAALRAARASLFKPPSVQTDYLLEYVFQLE
ncbi:MAG TPA: TonB family protein [Candidatus Eremiobacteraceae bacterium]|nr:TonB family protein [Candidatus Eremiobacteraceae bacterium]